jgi:proline dehydrogenase
MSMHPMRSLLLAGASSPWLKQRARQYRFVQRAVRRFLPGEELDDALTAAQALARQGFRTILTHLGENLTRREEATAVTEHYLGVLDRIAALNLPAVVSVKLTQLGLDLDPEFCFDNLVRIIERSGPDRIVWIDMESSSYVDRTLDLYERARRQYPGVGVCLQAYLYRTANDLERLLPLGPAIRLVKGAYREPPSVAYPRRRDVDANFFQLASRLLSPAARASGTRTVIGTHDRNLIARIQHLVQQQGLGRASLEFHMLYGIQRAEQLRLVADGWICGVLISYGRDWFPWFMRRLAERPANVLFVLRNLFAA